MSAPACLDCGARISIKATRCIRCATAHQHPDIDRAPKPCLHKRANHQHGTNACYVLDKCRCGPCCAARKRQDDWRNRQHAYGRYDKYVAAEPVRQHVRALMAQGMGWKRVAESAGVSGSSMWKLLYGKRQPDGSQTPSVRITRANADRLLAVALDLADGAMADDEQTATMRTQLRSLVALGWSMSKIAHRLGVTPPNMARLFHDEGVVLVGTCRAAAQLFEELSMRLPPEREHRDKIAASRARAYAQRHGWQPPLALEACEEPGDAPGLDEVAIWRRMQGDKGVRLSKDERIELAQRWAASGRSMAEMERVTGIAKPERYHRVSEATA